MGGAGWGREGISRHSIQRLRAARLRKRAAANERNQGEMGMLVVAPPRAMRRRNRQVRMRRSARSQVFPARE